MTSKQKQLKKYIKAIHDPMLKQQFERGLKVSQIASNMDFCAATIQKHLLRLGLKEKVQRVQCPTKNPSPPSERVNPITEAESWFNPPFAKERMLIKSGAFYLDGYPLNLNGVMRTLNTERQAAGQAQIDANPAWVV